ncbi:MAG: formylglycine-generating enzyme family protein, partial [Candidatus Sulfotelmatobacter sp.]
MTFRFSNLLPLLLICLASAWAQDTAFVPGGAGWDSEWQQIAGPKCLDTKEAWEGGSSDCTPADHDNWLADLKHWRAERLIRIGYNDSRYDLPALKWTQSSFMQPQMMVEDRY